MNVLSVAIGGLAVGYGVFIAASHAMGSTRLGKLAAMQARFGERAGRAVHLVAYAVLPVVFGILVLLQGMSGQSFFD